MSLCNTNQSLFKLRIKYSRLLEQLECNDALLVNKKNKILRQLCRCPEESVILRSEENVLKWKEKNESLGSSYCEDTSLPQNDLLSNTFRSLHVNSSLQLRSKLKHIENASSKKVKTLREGHILKPGACCPAVMAEKGKILAKRKDKKTSQQRRLKSNGKGGRPSGRSKIKNEKKQKPPCDIVEREDEQIKVEVPKEEVVEPSTPDICSRCLDEARHLLNYSPKSLFLRRMKQRLSKLETNDDEQNVSCDLSESKNDCSDICSECSSDAQNCSSIQNYPKVDSSLKTVVCPNNLRSAETLVGLHSPSSSNAQKYSKRHCLCARNCSRTCSNSSSLPDPLKYHITQNSPTIRMIPDVNGCNAPNCPKVSNVCNAPNCPKVPSISSSTNCPKVLNYVNVLNTLKTLRALKSPKEQMRENMHRRMHCCTHVQVRLSERRRSESRGSDDFCEKKGYKSESSCKEMNRSKQEHHLRATQKRCFSQPTFRNTCLKSHHSSKNQDAARKNMSRKPVQTRSNATQVSGKCCCKKESGGRCCCERDDLNIGPICKQCAMPCCTQEMSVQVPEAVERPGEVAREGNEDVCRDGGHKSVSTTTEPCLQHYEALCNFRQKHWFDCHAHPHGVPDLSDTKMQVASCSPDADILGPLEDPCFRLYCLNKRLFPEVFAETHGAGCCVAAQGACTPPTLLPNQRRLITLPALTPQYSLQNGNTMKLPCGVRFFPSSNVLVCDPKTLAAPPPPPTPPQPPQDPPTPSSPPKPRRMHVPVPTNSLALRFQKGVV